jgi:hypothetical protein
MKDLIIKLFGEGRESLFTVINSISTIAFVSAFYFKNAELGLISMYFYLYSLVEIMHIKSIKNETLLADKFNILSLKFLRIFTRFLAPIFILYSVIFTFNSSDKIIQLDSAINELNKKSEYIKLQKEKEKIITVNDPKQDCETYVLNINTSKIFQEQVFDKMQYTRSSSQQQNNDKILWENTCKTLTLRDMKIPSSIIGENVENFEVLAVFQNLLKEVKKQKGTLSIYVKGYADKESNKWKKPLNQEYAYNEIPYYKSNDTFQSSYKIEDANLRRFIVSGRVQNKFDGYFNNDDLPYLRANYVLDNYIKKYLTSCLQEPIKTGILEGRVIDQFEPKNRNTEIYVMLCAEKPYPSCAAH